MFKELSRTLGTICALVLAMIVVIFSTAFIISGEESTYYKQESPEQIIDTVLKIALTEQQKKGKSLFKTNCAACHKLFKKAVGPGLYGVTDRYEKEWLYKWIHNSAALIKSGDVQAVALYNEYNQANMNSFPNLTKEDIDAILDYIESSKN
ncbi:c-type cytochrome [Nonlabens sp. Asnod2-A12]|uniref:c-type cytochrome n=1 Tax=Nonlabens sp. Asnod2-A12 TaxID=3160578 RepID=UPI0038686CC9